MLPQNAACSARRQRETSGAPVETFEGSTGYEKAAGALINVRFFSAPVSAPHTAAPQLHSPKGFELFLSHIEFSRVLILLSWHVEFTLY